MNKLHHSGSSVLLESDSRQAPGFGMPTTGDEVSMGNLLQAAARQKLILILTIFLSVAGAIAAYRMVPPSFVAEVKLALDTRDGYVLDAGAAPPDQAMVRTEFDQFNSLPLAEQVVDQLDLQSDPEFGKAHWMADAVLPVVNGLIGQGERWIGSIIGREDAAAEAPPIDDPAVSPPPEAMEKAAVVRNVLDRLKIEADSRSYTATVSFSSSDPVKAATIANAFVEAYMAERALSRSKAMQDAGRRLEAQIAAMAPEVQKAESAVRAFREQAGLTESQSSTQLAQQFADLNTQLLMARMERSQAEARLNGSQISAPAAGRPGDGDPAFITSPLIQYLREQEAQLRRREAELMVQYGPQHPTLINLRAELSEARQKIAQEARRVVRELEAQVAIATDKQRSLEQQIVRLSDLSLDRARVESQAKELEKEAEGSRAFFDGLRNRHREIMGQVGFARAGVRVFSPAAVPLEPSSPKLILFVLAGLAGGIFAAAVMVALRERMQRGFIATRDVERETGFKVLSSIPLLPRKRMRSLVQTVVDFPRSRYNEALRTGLTVLMSQYVFSSSRVVVVTSCLPGEGKTTFCVSLAASLAKGGHRVLLIEADLRQPQVQSILEPKGSHAAQGQPVGLPEVLLGLATISEATRINPESGLHYIIATETRDTNPQDLFIRPSLRSLLADTASRYDFVFVDSPP
ncbi:GumC family protein [Skermanella pratensis]|uniref:GumC family protein n=1 Tax=Skermanella pratensis TaxID=2233999 RepID=UPI0017884095|nr:exopolysaccharide transport family protein [Skermanella pratensis]